jgi:hypothetical protein
LIKIEKKGARRIPCCCTVNETSDTEDTAGKVCSQMDVMKDSGRRWEENRKQDERDVSKETQDGRARQLETAGLLEKKNICLPRHSRLNMSVSQQSSLVVTRRMREQERVMG